jgi:hypothetical protein
MTQRLQTRSLPTCHSSGRVLSVLSKLFRDERLRT